jgi:hypothetical protein
MMEAADAQEGVFKFHPLSFLIFVFADVAFVSQLNQKLNLALN